MTTTTFELCTHPLSLVQGIYVIMQGDKVVATANTLDLVHEWLDPVTYQEADKVRIFLSSVDDFDTDEITHLLANDMFSDDQHDAGFASYAERVEITGEELAWLEFWFDEWGRVHQADYDRRRLRANEISGKVA